MRVHFSLHSVRAEVKCLMLVISKCSSSPQTTPKHHRLNAMLNENFKKKNFYHLWRFAISIKSCTFKCLINLLCYTPTSPPSRRFNLHNFSILLLRLLIELSLEHHPVEKTHMFFNHSFMYLHFATLASSECYESFTCYTKCNKRI